tara:strand:- start:381 stop:539 length:159 start_codon:yes stop_codon:yes gene_type:complete
MQDVVNELYDSDCGEALSQFETRGLEKVLELAREIIDMEDKIENILQNQYDS